MTRPGAKSAGSGTSRSCGHAPAGSSSATSPGLLPTAAAGDAAERLQRAKAMLDAGLISDSEYEALKAKIINQI